MGKVSVYESAAGPSGHRTTHEGRVVILFEGTWVQVKKNDGEVIYFPIHRVHEIVLEEE